ncbi:hypothetical protein L1987_62090 [Smallanthus sonchifolius]|uniref:Uncharacterized protein n=1 Tax=Smallanthus sonchifolius TaxID=185202 RepID=A0ACB9C9M4_9ASTR|nr:hypothetical protein L1987_62090 [Smallanthus sonchifolius]
MYNIILHINTSAPVVQFWKQVKQAPSQPNFTFTQVSKGNLFKGSISSIHLQNPLLSPIWIPIFANKFISDQAGRRNWRLLLNPIDFRVKVMRKRGFASDPRINVAVFSTNRI